jgi:hypothetical protein
MAMYFIEKDGVKKHASGPVAKRLIAEEGWQYAKPDVVSSGPVEAQPVKKNVKQNKAKDDMKQDDPELYDVLNSEDSTLLNEEDE